MCKFKVFTSVFTTWEALFQEAANFINKIGSDKVISISHSADRLEGVVTVWYRE